MDEEKKCDISSDYRLEDRPAVGLVDDGTSMEWMQCCREEDLD
jgi:hypothetical protein